MLKKITLFFMTIAMIFVLAGCHRPQENDIEYTVSFNCGFDYTIEDIKVKEGNLIIAPTEPVREGYEFLGWYVGEAKWNFTSDAVTENLTLTAKWEEKVHEHKYVDGFCECGEQDPATILYTLSFDTDGGSSIENVSLTAGSTITAPADPTKEGYTFKGWNPALPEVMPAKNLTVTAKWEAQTKAITYNLNGGELTGSYPTEFKVGEGATLPTPTKEGHEFKGWYDNSECTGDVIVTISKTTLTDVTVYAKWEEIDVPVVGEPFTITYELNGGAWTWSAPTVSDPASGIDAISNLPEIFMADFYSYLYENGLLNSSKVIEPNASD